MCVMVYSMEGNSISAFPKETVLTMMPDFYEQQSCSDSMEAGISDSGSSLE